MNPDETNNESFLTDEQKEQIKQQIIDATNKATEHADEIALIANAVISGAIGISCFVIGNKLGYKKGRADLVARLATETNKAYRAGVSDGIIKATNLLEMGKGVHK